MEELHEIIKIIIMTNRGGKKINIKKYYLTPQKFMYDASEITIK